MKNYKNIDANCSGTIKKILYDLIQNEYKQYLIENKKLLININEIREVLNNIYDNNNKRIKIEARKAIKNNERIKELHDTTIENLIFEIFSDKDNNLNIIKKEIEIVQDYNLKKIELPIINDSLNLNISIFENFVKINKVNIKNIENHSELYNNISNYEFIYSINNILLQEIDNETKIETIKSLIKGKKKIDLELYHIIK